MLHLRELLLCFGIMTLPMITRSEDCGVKIDFVIAIDASGSVGSDNFQKSLDFVKEVVSSSSIDDGMTRIGILTYSHYRKLIYNLNTYDKTKSMLSAIDNIQYTEGGTYTGSALKSIRDYMLTGSRGDRPDAYNVILLMTDGVSSHTDVKPKTIADSIHSNGVFLFVLGIGDGVSETELDDMASDPDETYVLRTPSFDELRGTGETTTRKICSVVAASVTTTTSTTKTPPTTTTEMITTTPSPTTAITTTTTTVTTTMKTPTTTTVATTMKTPTTTTVTTTMKTPTTTTVTTTMKTPTTTTVTTTMKTPTTTTVATTMKTPTTRAATTSAAAPSTSPKPELTPPPPTSPKSTTVAPQKSQAMTKRPSCKCPCSRLGDVRYVNLTNAEVNKLIEGFKHDLLRDKKSLSSGHRKTSSADDNRDSSQALGIMIVIVFIGAPCTILLLIDMDRFLRWFDQKFRSMKSENNKQTEE